MIVDDYDRTVSFYCDMIDGELETETSIDGKVDVAFLRIPGRKLEVIARQERGTYLDELLDDLRDHTPYHVAYTVPDIEAAMRRLDEHDIQMYNQQPVGGVGAYVRAFVKPGAVPGLPIELVELKDE
jgi:catechol 2,3-dioxygenase-like lactoylglutathione lyase family enzyme